MTNGPPTYRSSATSAPTHRSPSAGSLRLAVLATHPIQYYTPWFRHLATLFDLEVLYMHQQDAAGQSAAGFGVRFDWDVPLLDGYCYRWLKNVSRKPGLQTFGGCDTPELYNLISPEKYDALLVLGWNKRSFIQGIRAARRNKVPVLARGDSQLTTERSTLKRALKFVPYRWFLPCINAHLYVGQRNREYLRHYGVQDKQLFFSPHFVDNERFAKQTAAFQESRFEIRNSWRIPRDAFVPLFVGKFIPQKRPLDLVKAAQLLVTRHSPLNIHLLFVGSGELGSELRANCNVVFDSDQSVARSSVTRSPASVVSRPLPMASFTHFLNQTEISNAYVAADVLVLPGDETWGLVVNEAMTCGIPAIVSDAAGCAPDLIETDVTGWTFPMSDITALAQRMIHFRRCNRHDLRNKSESFSMEKATIGLTQAMVSLLTSKE